ncbi:hypothetical protein AGABI1DRAFT_115116 [Agaricus bisporus var. burnettii JB137-S8]|uniref:Haloacid dehalogenase n=1 Tax=Agaricus bisporus var. burnettii (strain JB137-S8 / ATCC MYA-4627 / FGSC 10392) TaxID=597362 RepID=K5WQA9_AGABU|nr:uncharacterized protein AGABI1DRAFT_115116 [Agaricus bisporus var. burnettii JB137-S8]EKM77536.1 hypothetical protein AGABI1DRAFT_115116 [Agaricus bisporus var. burnettii JB137-S8]
MSQAKAQPSSQPQSEKSAGNLLKDVDVLIFDIFGSVVDWRTSVAREVQEVGKKHGIDPANANWANFVQQWRDGYLNTVRVKAQQDPSSVPSNLDIMHRQILDELIVKPEWNKYTSSWTEEDKTKLVFAWHRLRAWPDVVHSLLELKKYKIVVALSNGNIRLLLDMARYANLPWDTIFSSELFNAYKPNPKVYLETVRLLSTTPEKCVLTGAHLWDARGAAGVGMKTIYIPRPDEDDPYPTGQSVKTKAEGGEVDLVIDSFEDLVRLVKENHQGSRL